MPFKKPFVQCENETRDMNVHCTDEHDVVQVRTGQFDIAADKEKFHRGFVCALARSRTLMDCTYRSISPASRSTVCVERACLRIYRSCRWMILKVRKNAANASPSTQHPVITAISMALITSRRTRLRSVSTGVMPRRRASTSSSSYAHAVSSLT